MTAPRERQQPMPIFVVKLQGKPGAAGIRALRWVLKVLLRRHGFKCLEAHEVRE
jgi:hypothetical protein